jgi:phosphate:Na+ symporter
MDILQIIFGVLGGLALFLFGLKLLSEGLQKAAGNKFKKILESLTNNKFRGVATGAITTAVVQSSSVVTVSLIGLINAGLITLMQAAPVIMGANIGTTITAQLVAFKINHYALPILALGFFLYMIGNNNKKKNIGQSILGFGLLFLGMNTMVDGVTPLRESVAFTSMLAEFGHLPVLGVLAGLVFTIIVQSSSATTGLVIAMGMSGIITLSSAIAVIFGANIGTCITAMIASIGSNLSSKRAAVFHVLFNVIGVLLFLPFIVPFTSFISLTSGNLPRQIANAHISFNIITTLILLPFLSMLIKLTRILIKGDEVKLEKGTKYLDELTLNIPPIALGLARKEVIRMAEIASTMLQDSKKALFNKDKESIQLVFKKEEEVDTLDNEIERYLTKLSQKSLSKTQSRELAILIHAITDIERVADHAHNITESAQYKNKNKIEFSPKVMEELTEIFNATDESYRKVIDVLKGNKKLGKRVLDLEVKVDLLQKKLEKNHFERLKKGICKVEAGPIYLDIIRNLERISDHAHNIAYAIMIGF